MKKLLAIICTCCLLVSCATVKKPIEIPTITAVRPERPSLLESPDEVATMVNLVRVMGYSQGLEAYADALEAWVEQIGKLYETL